MTGESIDFPNALTFCAQYGSAFLHADPNERYFTGARDLCHAMADYLEAVSEHPDLLQWHPPPDNALIDLRHQGQPPLAVRRAAFILFKALASCTAVSWSLTFTGGYRPPTLPLPGGVR